MSDQAAHYQDLVLKMGFSQLFDVRQSSAEEQIVI
jgi:hypothetical protein